MECHSFEIEVCGPQEFRAVLEGALAAAYTAYAIAGRRGTFQAIVTFAHDLGEPNTVCLVERRPA